MKKKKKGGKHQLLKKNTNIKTLKQKQHKQTLQNLLVALSR